MEHETKKQEGQEESLLRRLYIGWVTKVRGNELAQQWNMSNDPSDMLWLAARMTKKPGWPAKQQVVLAACACAETALKHIRYGERRPRKALETARGWARGEVKLAQVKETFYGVLDALDRVDSPGNSNLREIAAIRQENGAIQAVAEAVRSALPNVKDAASDAAAFVGRDSVSRSNLSDIVRRELPGVVEACQKVGKGTISVR